MSPLRPFLRLFGPRKTTTSTDMLDDSPPTTPTLPTARTPLNDKIRNTADHFPPSASSPATPSSSPPPPPHALRKGNRETSSLLNIESPLPPSPHIHMTDYQLEEARKRYDKWRTRLVVVMVVCVVDVGVLDWLWVTWAGKM